MVRGPSPQGSSGRRVALGFGSNQPTVNFKSNSKVFKSGNNLSYWLMYSFLARKNPDKQLKET